MSLRLSALALLAAAATLAATAAHAGGLAPNLNIAVNGAVMAGRHPIIGYGPSFVPQPTFGGVRPPAIAAPPDSDPNSQFEGCSENISSRAGNTALKPFWPTLATNRRAFPFRQNHSDHNSREYAAASSMARR